MIPQLKKYRNLNYEERESKIYGVVIAIVTNNKDPEGLARVKLKFPWMGEAKDKETNWARVATLMAGKERGSYFIPEVEDEVLVLFENGDINYPYVVGALWNGKDKPTEKNSDGKNDIRSITSRSGHKILFNDKEGEEVMEFIDKSKKRRITFKVKEKILEIDNQEDGGIKIVSKGKIIVESDEDIDISSKKNINIKAKGDIAMEANNIKLKSKSATELNVGSKLDINASKAPVKIKSNTLDISGTVTKIKGATKLEMSGGMVNLKATGNLDLSGAIASLKGNITKLG